MVILLLGLLFIINTTALTLLFAVYYTNAYNSKGLIHLSALLVAVNILINAIVFAIIF